jgi:prepilin-type N-terminal cleavage/methylation domain-containing protein
MQIYFLNRKAFTLIELLVVIAIIGLLSSMSVYAINVARMKARDARRFADIKQIQTALALYYDDNNTYPTSDYDGCGGWDVGNVDYELLTNKLNTYMADVPRDTIATGDCSGYRYYKYSAGYAGCDPSKGSFYVLGITDLETSSRPHPSSPGWSCPSRNWQGEFDYVLGAFEIN